MGRILVSGKNNRKLMVMGILLGSLLFGCTEKKFTQCEQIFHIANSVTENSKNVSSTKAEKQTAIKSWLEAADMFNMAADKIQALDLDDSELINYQNGLVTIYRIYSQATYDAIDAREGSNLEALKTARIDAKKAGKIQQSLIKEINAYCVKQ